jgi:uncharacterized protein YndB with AHSA1/START domain
MSTTGLTQDAGWQAGASRTFSVDKATAWSALVSPAGLRAWLGRLEALPTTTGDPYETEDGVRGEVRSWRPEERLRLRWQLRGRSEPAILQVALSESRGGTVVRLHADHLADADERAQVLEHFAGALDRLARVIEEEPA